MKQEIIMALLIEAADPECARGRREDILQSFRDAATNPFKHGRSKAWALDTLLVVLYRDTIRYRPEKLPILFPLFATLCSDRRYPKALFVTVDWSVLDKNQEETLRSLCKSNG